MTDLVATLEAELNQRENQLKQLELALRNKENGNLEMVPELTKKMMKLERSLTAKQVFCETLIKDNDRLKKLLEEMNLDGNKQEDKRDSVDGMNQNEGSYVPVSIFRSDFEIMKLLFS